MWFLVCCWLQLQTADYDEVSWQGASYVVVYQCHWAWLHVKSRNAKNDERLAGDVVLN